MNSHPDPNQWIRLDAAADELKVPRQALADQLKLAGREVQRIENDGRWSTFVRRIDVGLRPLDAPEASHEDAGIAFEPSQAPATIWAQVCALQELNQSLRQKLELAHEHVRHDSHLEEAHREREARLAAELAEREARVEAERLERERVQLELERARVELERLETMRLAEVARAREAAEQLERERERAARLEHELHVMFDFERAYVNYCDRLEERLRSTPADRRRAG